jgi:hypothetical protein
LPDARPGRAACALTDEEYSMGRQATSDQPVDRQATTLSDAEALLLRECWLKMGSGERVSYNLLVYSTLVAKGLVRSGICGSISITLAGEALLCSLAQMEASGPPEASSPTEVSRPAAEPQRLPLKQRYRRKYAA